MQKEADNKAEGSLEQSQKSPKLSYPEKASPIEPDRLYKIGTLFTSAAMGGGPDPPPERCSSLLTSPLLSHPANSILRDCAFFQMHKDFGNKFVQRIVEKNNIKSQKLPFRIQAKLKIGSPNDIYEQEADRVAEQVMCIPEPSCPECEEEKKGIIQTKPLSAQIAPLVQRQVEEEDEEVLQLKGNKGETPEVTSDLESRIQSLKRGGRPLPENTRAFTERRFGVDFSNVRIHSDSNAAELNRELNAQAFSSGRDIYFGEGRYNPNSSSGKRLLAHELTHVIQQEITRTSTFSGPTVIHRREPRPKRAPSLELRWDFYPGTPRNVVEQQMRYVAEGRKEEEITKEIRPIESFEDIFAELGGYAHFWKERHNVPSISPFVREIHILGHGHVLPGEGMRIGAEMYSESDLEKFSTGWGRYFMKSNARIVLEGCSVAGGYSGRKFIYEVARVFFGEKVGYIRASTCISFLVYKETKRGIRPELTECSSVECKYPDDFRKGGKCSLEEF